MTEQSDDVVAAPSSSTDNPPSLRRIVLSGAIGNFIENYDFVLPRPGSSWP